MEKQYASVTNLAKIFDIGRTKATELVHLMEIDPDFKDNVISFSHRKKNVNIEAFREFLVTKVSRQWVK
nr:MAG TPA: DNA TRANSLOCASE FTSK, KOPS, XERCD, RECOMBINATION, DNA [Caudoviricetes sp.]DAP92643.1 MAG TPA: DNA TRANSLOCASE FTSK, KOPS, XERCD, RECOMBINATION, DNA [Bacteriophage sp.]